MNKEIKKGDLIIIRDCENDLEAAQKDFEEKWDWHLAMLTYSVSDDDSTIQIATEIERAQEIVDNKKTNEEYVLQYNDCFYDKEHKGNKMTAVVLDIFREQHRDLDVIKMSECNSIIRYTRRAIIERFVANK